MRAFEDIIRLSAERLASRRPSGFLTPTRSKGIVVAALAFGFALVIVWAFTLIYFLFRLAMWLFA